MKAKSKFWLSILCFCCLLPAMLLASGRFTIRRPGGMSTMGVIIGPIILPEDNLIGGGIVVESPDYSSYNLSADTPYTNGALRNYSTIGVYNVNRGATHNGFNYLNFVRAMKIKRTDGRPIYDDDGILDVSDNASSLAAEIVNYPSYIYAIETTLPNKPNAGFMWTNQQAKFKSTKFKSTFSNGSTSTTIDEGVSSQPSDGTETIVTIMDKDFNVQLAGQKSLIIYLKGTGQYENTFWGNTGGDTSINTNLTNYITLGSRSWSNSLNSSAVSGTYKGAKAYYSPKSFNVTATNLNNYIKINDVTATPKYGTSVVPFADGHHISITNEGITTVAIENGSEGVYTTYYCYVDTKLPDVYYTYHNANALNKRVVGAIQTSANGSKSQTIYEGVFRNQVQVNFSYDEGSESPETATYTFNGKTYNLTNGTWLNDEGSYTVTITDKAGNTTVSKFDIDKTAPSYNLDRLSGDTNYKITKWYLTTIPSGYSGYGTYSFAQRKDALSFACNIERQNNVTKYTLNNIDEFKATNLVANGNTVKVGDYWYYKSKDNPSLYVYYFDENSLMEAIEYYAKEFVSDEQVYRLNDVWGLNNYGTSVDKSVLDNIIISNEIKSFIANNFTFRYKDDFETYKIYCDYQEDNKEVWKELIYNTAFTNQVNSHGLYKIKEVDFAGNEVYYYVYLDTTAPLLDIEAKLYGKDKTITQTISVADIPKNGELIFYYESFKINEIIENDKWWILEIKCPDNSIKRYTHLDELPNFDDLGSGEFTITIADRLNNSFQFKVCLLGKAPEAKFEAINANTQLQISIIQNEDFNTITGLKIYRNGVCLNSQNGYDELPDNDNNELIFIDVNTTKYIFNKGGIYTVEITDNFGRTLSYEHKFEKDLPTGLLVGVEHNGKTKNKVEFVYDGNKYFVVVTKNSQSYQPKATSDDNIDTLYFSPEEDSEDVYIIQLVDKLDTENYNIYSFTIKTIKPILHLYGVEPNGTTGSDVYATWEVVEEQYTATYTLNGTTNNYRKGQILTAEGNYTITLSDEIGNTNSVNFNIDKSINFTIADVNGKTYKIEDIRYINFDVRLIANEPLNITVTRDDKEIEYDFGLMFTEEGYYVVRLSDEYDNSLFFYFTIDKTAPIATLYGVEEFGKTKGNVWVASAESNLTCWYVIDEEKTGSYRIGEELTQNGKYIVFISDLAKNIVSFEFEIDKEIAFDINTYHGGISNGDVKLVAYENLQIVMFKDELKIDYEFEQILKEEGEYSFTIVDDLGNRYSSFFRIINKKKQNLNHLLQENIVVESVVKDEENFEFTITENNLYLHEEGHYVVSILDEKNNEKYSFEITIDTTPPTLELVNVENGGKTKKVVILKNVSEQPYELKIYVDGIPFDYKLGDEIEKDGQFEVILSDEAGNTTTYSFYREYSLNAASIGVIAGLGALVVLLIILLIKSRHRYYKDEVVEEEIEETIIEDDFNDGDENIDDTLEDKE